jgi:hypothetical protein
MGKFAIQNGRGFQVTFENGWKISVMFGEDMHYADNQVHTEVGFTADNAEVAVFYPNGEFYPLEEQDEVRGRQTAEEVCTLMCWVMSRPKDATKSATASESDFDDFIIGVQCDEQSPPPDES